MQLKAIIDRFEGKVAICEQDGKMITISKTQLPSGAQEGDVLILSDEGIKIDALETKLRKKKAEVLLKKLQS